MNPKHAFRRLRDDDRWIGVPASRIRRRAATAPRTLLLRSAAVTLLMLLVVGGASIAVVHYSAQHPAHVASPTPSFTSTTSSAPTASPAPTDEVQALRCGQAVPASELHGDTPGMASLPKQAGSAELWIKNFAAAGSAGNTTTVAARFSAGAADGSNGSPIHYDGALQVALVRDGAVVATGAGPALNSSVAFADTSLVFAPLTARSCSTHDALPDGMYGIIATGVRAHVDGRVLVPVNDIRTVHLQRGLLVGGLVTAADGPWRGTGVPTCGTAFDAAEQVRVHAFADASTAELAAKGARLTSAGIMPHANAQGWDLTVALREFGLSTVVVSTTRNAATTVIADGHVVSAPDSGASTPSAQTLRLRAGASFELSTDAARAACGLSSDYTEPEGAIPGPVHTAYIDFGTTVSGVPVVTWIRYRFGIDGRPAIVP